MSLDLPFAMNRFCGAESIKNMRVGSDYQDRNFGKNYGTLIEELKIECRAVFVLDTNGKVVHAEYVSEVTSEPDYEAAIEALRVAAVVERRVVWVVASVDPSRLQCGGPQSTHPTRRDDVMDTTRKLVAEAIGTFFLCFAGIAAILSTHAADQ